MEEEGAPRPNIRIEIQNNLAEGMEVEEADKGSDGEEGEICDGNDAEENNKTLTYTSTSSGTTNSNNRIWPNPTGIFEGGDKERLQERAKRFALPANQTNVFTERELLDLNESLGISAENEENVRFDAVKMHGVDDMCTEDVLEYFGKYAPSGIEWISEGNCNVVWLDRMAAAKALYFSSKKVRGMPVLNEEEGGRSILLKNSQREVEISMDEEVDKENGSEVNIKDIEIEIPQGFWRLGFPHHKTRFILLRFAFRTDKKAIRVEKFNDLNVRLGGLKGITSESKKARMRGIFGRNREMDVNENKNPWGNLARNWHEDARYAEFDYRHKVDPPVTNVSTPLQKRLGFKRAHKSEEKEKVEDEQEVQVEEKEKKPKSKVPRMRMYADEEEEKIKRKRQLKVLKAGLVKLENKNEDLRNILPSRKKPIPEPDVAYPHLRNHEPELKEPLEVVVDLGSRLKNRKVNSVRQENIRTRMIERREQPRRRTSPARKKRREPEYDEDYEDQKTSSKVTVVIKKQKTPAVASTIWSRMHSERERLKTVSEGKLRVRSSSSSSESSSESSDSSSDSESSHSASPSPPPQPKKPALLQRPGFRSDLKSRLDFKATEHKSPLRIEINNDHFRKD